MVKDNFSRYKDIKSNLIVGSESLDETPMVSIVIPTYKRPKLLKEAIDSALGQQGFDDYEVIVVDNDADNEYEIDGIIKKYSGEKIKYYRNEKNIGMFGNWNRCIELAKGQWISILNDDDYLRTDFLLTWFKLAQRIEADFYQFDIYMDGSFVESRSKFYSWFKVIVKKVVYFNYSDRMLRKVDFVLGNRGHGTLAAMINKNKSITAGGFDEDYWPSSDHAFWITILNSGCTLYSSSKKLAWCRTEDSRSLKKETIIGWSQQFERIIWLIIRKEKKIIYRVFAKSIKGYLIWRLYKEGRLSKCEFKDKNINRVSMFFVIACFYFFYLIFQLYTQCASSKF